MREQAKHKGWKRILLIIFPYLFVGGIFQIVGASLAGADLGDINAQRTSEQELLIQFFSFMGTLLVVWLFVKYIDKMDFVDIGLRIKHRVKELWIGFSIGMLIMFLGFGLLQLLNEIQYEEAVFNFKELVALTILFLLVSLGEEILLRGYVLRNLMNSFNKYFSLILSSVLFSLMHGLNPNIDILGFTNIFLAGILLGITYIHTKNLWFPIGLHFSWNFFQSILGFNVSGQNVYSLINFDMNEQTLLNGGAFGFEGSILSSVAMLLTVIAIIIYYRRNEPTKNLLPTGISGNPNRQGRV